MISTLDGAITLNGRSGPLGGPADHRIFQTLRSLADVILVGAGTVRTEGYGPARLDHDLSERRRERGQSVAPPIAVVTRSANLDWSSPFFTAADERPIVFTTADRDRTVRLPGEDVAHFVVAGEERVDVSLVLDYLHRSGLRSVLLEGGPGLNADVVHAGLLNELCLTVSPLIVAGTGPRILAGAELADPLGLELIHLLEEDGFFFYRFTVRQPRNRASAGHDAVPDRAQFFVVGRSRRVRPRPAADLADRCEPKFRSETRQRRWAFGLPVSEQFGSAGTKVFDYLVCGADLGEEPDALAGVDGGDRDVVVKDGGSHGSDRLAARGELLLAA